MRLVVGPAADLRALLDYRDDLLLERTALANRAQPTDSAAMVVVAEEDTVEMARPTPEMIADATRGAS